MTRLSAVLEGLSTALEDAAFLDGPAASVKKVTGALGPGRLKDLLSGTPLGHPLHPLLVAVPIGAFSAATVLDLTGGDEDAARRLVGLGILSSLPAAAAGASDWSDTDGAEQRLGLVHAAVNSAALTLMAGSWIARRRSGRGQLLSLAGFALLSASGWLGGHLSYALGVGVDTTAFTQLPAEWTDACAESDLVEGTPQGISILGSSVLVLRRGGVIHVLSNRCTHRGAPLNEGPVVDDCIECPWHGSRFRLDDGAVERGPATRPQAVLETRIIDGRVQVRRQESRALRTNPV